MTGSIVQIAVPAAAALVFVAAVYLWATRGPAIILDLAAILCL